MPDPVANFSDPSVGGDPADQSSSTQMPTQQSLQTPPSSQDANSPQLNQAVSQPPEGAAPKSFRDSLASQGYDLSAFKDEESLAQAVISYMTEQQKQQQDNQHLVELGRQVLPHASQFSEWQKQQLQQQQAQAQPEPKKPAWEMPDYNNDWDSKTQWDESRRSWVAVDGGWPAALRAAEERNAYEEAARNNMQRLLKDPVAIARQGLGLPEGVDTIEEYVSQAVEKAVSAERARTEAQVYLSQRERELYQFDPQGNVVFDPRNNEPALSPVGEATLQYLTMLQQSGVTDISARRQLAEALVERDKFAGRFGDPSAQTQPPSNEPAGNGQPPLTPEQIGEQKRKRFVDRIPSRDGSLAGAMDPTAPVTQNPDASLSELNRQVFQQKGLRYDPD